MKKMTEQQTSDREKKIAEIREALEKATQGPWTKFENRIYGKAQPAVEPIICEFYEEETERDRNNAHLIANAPEWLRFLLSEIEHLEREYAEERAAHNAHVAELCELEKENRRLREDIEKIIKILKNGQRAHWQTFKIRQLLEVPLE